MPFKRYVEVGRVVLINYGPEEGKLATVIDIVDQNKCLIDGPSTNVPRQVIPYKRLALTKLKVDIGKNAKTSSLKKAWETGDISNKWESCSWAKKLAAQKTRASLGDFDRFKVMKLKQKRSKIIAKKMAEMSS